MADESKVTTVGEELWRVHLRRQTGITTSEEDFDRSPRKRAQSVGEELWEIHVKRSRGVDLSYDSEESVLKTSPKQGTVGSKGGGCPYNLRNRKQIQ